MNTNKILFLDFDGVLNAVETMILRPGQNKSSLVLGFDKHLMLTLNFLCRTVPDMRIVISSSWRKIDTFPEILDMMWDAGFKYTDRVIGVTPSLNVERGYEIEQYCKFNDIHNYCIVDDSIDMLPTQLDRFVRTNPMIGLTMLDVLRIVKIFDNTNEFYKDNKFYIDTFDPTGRNPPHTFTKRD